MIPWIRITELYGYLTYLSIHSPVLHLKLRRTGHSTSVQLLSSEPSGQPSFTPLQTCQCEVTKNSNNFFVHVKDCPIRKFALEKLVCIWLYFCWVSENMINSHTHTRYSLPIEWNGRKKGFFRPFHSMYIQYIVSPFLPRHGWFIVSYDTYYKNSSLERQESGLALEHIPTSGSSDFFLYFFNNYLKRKPSHNYSHCFVISFNIIL